jgi:hypothetical protein
VGGGWRPSFKGVFEGVLGGWIGTAILSVAGVIVGSLADWYRAGLKHQQQTGSHVSAVGSLIVALPPWVIVGLSLLVVTICVWILRGAVEWALMSRRHRRRKANSTPIQPKHGAPTLPRALPSIDIQSKNTGLIKGAKIIVGEMRDNEQDVVMRADGGVIHEPTIEIGRITKSEEFLRRHAAGEVPEVRERHSDGDEGRHTVVPYLPQQRSSPSISMMDTRKFA